MHPLTVLHPTHFTPPLSSQDAEMLGLVRVDKARRAICSCGEKVCPRELCMHTILSHVTRHTWHLARTTYQIGAPTSQLARANFYLGARQLIGWRAPSDKLARQVYSWRVPSPVLARAKSSFGAWFGFIGNVVVWLVFVLSWLSHWCRCVHCSMLV